MSEVHEAIISSARLVADELSTTELISLCLAAQLEVDPQRVAGYDKARALFAEEDGMRMHSATRDALIMIMNERLEEEKVSRA